MLRSPPVQDNFLTSNHNFRSLLWSLLIALSPQHYQNGRPINHRHQPAIPSVSIPWWTIVATLCWRYPPPRRLGIGGDRAVFEVWLGLEPFPYY
ncbi:hypothetical protein IV203_038196 [Nitzschia inconspicua]|uniref:Uncharacterized protein n=1 Tax=Nitzschia inconspicua TaxID=303405 RepID=A0A9K3PZ30_9STRA|nr:hypothetical protein IV203_038196 [Nitzschia inconspicua]